MTPISFDFGSLAVGATSTAPFTIENQGGQTTGPKTLDRGAHCTAAVTFAPVVAGTKASTLFITASPGNHTGATLTATAAAVDAKP